MGKRKIIKNLLFFVLFCSYLLPLDVLSFQTITDQDIYDLEHMGSNKISMGYSNMSDCNYWVEEYNISFPNKSRSICFQKSNDSKFYYIICDGENSCSDETNYINGIIPRAPLSSGEIGTNGYVRFPGCDVDSRLEGSYLVSGCYTNLGNPEYTFNDIGYYSSTIDEIGDVCPIGWEIISNDWLGEDDYNARNFDNIWTEPKPGIVIDGEQVCYGDYSYVLGISSNSDYYLHSTHRTSTCYNNNIKDRATGGDRYKAILCVQDLSLGSGNGQYPGCDTPDIVLDNGQIWSACNVGSSIAGTGGQSYGDYFQWGRDKPFDGFDTSERTTKISNYDKDNDNDGFVSNTSFSYYEDWYDGGENKFWNLDDTNIGRQGVCADGYHIPTTLEWQSAVESITGRSSDLLLTGSLSYSNYTESFTRELLLPLAGLRTVIYGSYINKSYQGMYMTSSDINHYHEGETYDVSRIINFKTTTNDQYFCDRCLFGKGNGLTVRCIKNTGINSCSEQPDYENANFVEGEPTSIDQAWQNDDSSEGCYYSCTDGYSGDDCSIAPSSYSCASQPNYSNANFVEGNPQGNNQAWQNFNSSRGCYYSCINGYSGDSCNIPPSGGNGNNFKWVRVESPGLHFNPQPGFCTYQREGAACNEGDPLCINRDGYDLDCKNESFYIQSYGLDLDNCTSVRSSLTHRIHNTDGNIKLCQEFELTQTSGNSNTHYCTEEDDFIDAWARDNYDSSTQTTSSYVSLYEHPIYLAGRYRLAAYLPDGQIVYGNWYTIDSTNGVNCQTSTEPPSGGNSGGWTYQREPISGVLPSPAPLNCGYQGKREGDSCNQGDSFCPLNDSYNLVCKNNGLEDLITVESFGTDLNNCLSINSSLTHRISNTDGNIKICQEFDQLTVTGREQDYHYCTDPNDFIEGWAVDNYDSSTQTTSSSVSLNNHTSYVPGRYRLAVLLPNGEIVHGNYYTIGSTNGQSCSNSTTQISSGGNNEGFYINTSGRALNNCSAYYSSFTHTIYNTDGNIQLCQEFELSAIGREGQSHYCTNPSDFQPVSWVGQTYNSLTRTSSTRVSLQNHTSYVPGRYRLAALLPDGQIIYGNPYRISSINNINCWDN